MALLVSFLFAACGGTASVGVKASSTTALAQSADTAATTDPAAPVSADALLLHVVSTDAHVVAAPERGQAEPKTTSDGWTTISTQARDVDLKSLAATPSDIAGGAVAAGKLIEIRLVLDASDPADLVVAGAKTAVVVPSGAESGLKLDLAPPVDLQDGSSETLAVQFDGALLSSTDGLTLSPSMKLVRQ